MEKLKTSYLLHFPVIGFQWVAAASCLLFTVWKSHQTNKSSLILAVTVFLLELNFVHVCICCKNYLLLKALKVTPTPLHTLVKGAFVNVEWMASLITPAGAVLLYWSTQTGAKLLSSTEQLDLRGDGNINLFLLVRRASHWQWALICISHFSSVPAFQWPMWALAATVCSLFMSSYVVHMVLTIVWVTDLTLEIINSPPVSYLHELIRNLSES